LHLKYRCVCGQDHWLSYLEASTQNFKVVCNCGIVFKVKRINKFKVSYYKNKKNHISKNKKSAQTIPQDLLNKCVKILVPYGFTITESSELLSEVYMKNPTDDCIVLVKNTLASLKG
jgi:hypothetical protein